MTKEHLELLKKKRILLRAAVTKAVKDLYEELLNEVPNEEAVVNLIDILSIKFESLTLVDQELEPLFNADEFYSEFETSQEYREKVLLCQIRAERKINAIKNSNNVPQPILPSSLPIPTEQHPSITKQFRHRSIEGIKTANDTDWELKTELEKPLNTASTSYYPRKEDNEPYDSVMVDNEWGSTESSERKTDKNLSCTELDFEMKQTKEDVRIKHFKGSSKPTDEDSDGKQLAHNKDAEVEEHWKEEIKNKDPKEKAKIEDLKKERMRTWRRQGMKNWRRRKKPCFSKTTFLFDPP